MNLTGVFTVSFSVLVAKQNPLFVTILVSNWTWHVSVTHHKVSIESRKKMYLQFKEAVDNVWVHTMLLHVYPMCFQVFMWDMNFVLVSVSNMELEIL